MVDFENRKHTKFQFNWSISFRGMNFLINFNMQILNVPSALGFEVKHSKFLCISFRTYIIILSLDFMINKFFKQFFFLLPNLKSKEHFEICILKLIKKFISQKLMDQL